MRAGLTLAPVRDPRGHADESGHSGDPHSTALFVADLHGDQPAIGSEGQTGEKAPEMAHTGLLMQLPYQ